MLLLSPLYLVVLASVSVHCVERGGRLSEADIAQIEDMLNESEGDIRSIEIPPPPLSELPHRGIMCSLGGSHYCPGEVLFR